MGQVHSKLSTPPEVVVPWSLTFPLCCHLCACHTIPCHPVIQILFLFLYINIYIHTPSYWFYCNGWKLRKKTLDVIVFRLFMLYLLKGHKTQNTNRNTTDIKRFFSRLYFFTLSQKTKVVFFNFSRNFRGDARPGPHLSPFRTQSNNSGYSFYVFIKGFRRYGTSLHSPFFCLNCTTVPLYYILRIKLWYCFKSLFFIYRSTKFSIL